MDCLIIVRRGEWLHRNPWFLGELGIGNGGPQQLHTNRVGVMKRIEGVQIYVPYICTFVRCQINGSLGKRHRRFQSKFYWRIQYIISYACYTIFHKIWIVTPKCTHDDVIKWKHIPRYWPFVRGIHRSPVAQRPVTRSFDVFYDLSLE